MPEDLGSLDDVALLRLWQGKALVCVCRDHLARETRGRGGSPYLCGGAPGEWCGPQRKAERAYAEILRRKIPLPRGMYLALSEDNSCGRRKLGSPTEFDALMNAHIACLESTRGA